MNWDHLCDSCLDDFATCVSDNVVFGIDVDPLLAFHKDADRVIKCASYMNRLPDLPDGIKR